MANYKEIRYCSDVCADTDASTIVKDFIDVGLVALSRDHGTSGLVNKCSMDADTYSSKNDSVRKAILAYCGSKAGIDEITESKHILNAFDNPTFESVYNAIFADSLLGIMTRTAPDGILSMANVDEVEIGGSLTYEIESKGLPIAQRNSYMSNVTFLEGIAKTPITVVPKVYSTGVAVDVIRMLKGDVDLGREIAKIAMSMLYAQYKLVVSTLFNTTLLTGTPLYRSTFTAESYILTAQYLQALNNGASVKAYGTIPAFHGIGVVATTNYGHATQDDIIRTGYIGQAYGIQNVVIDQATDLSAPFVGDDAAVASLMLVPNDKILLLSDIGDKPVKLVRENYIRVINKEANTNAINRREYSYFMSFDAGIATQAHFAIQDV